MFLGGMSPFRKSRFSPLLINLNPLRLKNEVDILFYWVGKMHKFTNACNPNDPCFDWKRPSFEGVKAKIEDIHCMIYATKLRLG